MKGLLLLSSGIDSPVAGRMMMDKGVEVTALHLMLVEKPEEERKVAELARKIGVKKLFSCDIRPAHESYARNCNPRYTCLFCKRTMLRLAEKIALQEQCDFIITGENMGQVASQTLDNMVVTTDAVKMMILRPLLGFDKNETINIARKFGTYELSIIKSPACPFLPRHPSTMARLEKVKEEEARIDVVALTEVSAAGLRLIF